MATVSITFDTNAKTVAVTVDGKPVEDVVEAYVCKRCSYDDKDEGFTCSVSTMSKDEESDVRTHTRLVACESVEGKQVIARAGAIPGPVEGFVVAEAVNKAQADIASYFSKR